MWSLLSRTRNMSRTMRIGSCLIRSVFTNTNSRLLFNRVCRLIWARFDGILHHGTKQMVSDEKSILVVPYVSYHSVVYCRTRFPASPSSIGKMYDVYDFEINTMGQAGTPDHLVASSRIKSHAMRVIRSDKSLSDQSLGKSPSILEGCGYGHPNSSKGGLKLLRTRVECFECLTGLHHEWCQNCHTFNVN
ncbi:hypothetical protein BJV74DRAFT_182321 [Russula compacta]|nr:hypothetical protein BJV74DRAFT_182321 [Russula compacta]